MNDKTVYGKWYDYVYICHLKYWKYLKRYKIWHTLRDSDA